MKQSYGNKTLLPVIFISVLLYLNTLYNDFVYDDAYIITENYFIKTLKNLPKLFHKDYLPLSGELSYRPVVTITYFTDYVLWHLNPLGYHLTNILLHAVNVFLFYRFIKIVFCKRTTTLIAALLYASHPVLTETVNAVCYREDILACIFFLLSFIYFTKTLRLSKINTRFVLYYGISGIAYFLSLFSKEMAITLPILLVSFDLLCSPKYAPYRYGSKRETQSISHYLLKIRNRLCFYSAYVLITGFYLYIRFIAFKNTFKTIDVTPSSVSTMTKVVASYVKLLFIPLRLNGDYYVPNTGYASTSFVLSVVFIISALIIMLRLHRKNHLLTFFNAWFFVTLLPVLGIVPIGNIMAERYLYLPIIGLCGTIGCILEYSPFRKSWIIITGIIILGMQIYVVERNGVWRDDATLWSYTYKREPHSARACGNLGNTYFKNKRYEDAIRMYKKSLTLPYSYPFIHYNLGATYEKAGFIDKAIEEYRASLSNLNDNTLAFNNLGTLYDKQGLYDLAIDAYKQALSNNPYFPLSHNNLGNTGFI